MMNRPREVRVSFALLSIALVLYAASAVLESISAAQFVSSWAASTGVSTPIGDTFGFDASLTFYAGGAVGLAAFGVATAGFFVLGGTNPASRVPVASALLRWRPPLSSQPWPRHCITSTGSPAHRRCCPNSHRLSCLAYARSNSRVCECDHASYPFGAATRPPDCATRSDPWSGRDFGGGGGLRLRNKCRLW